MAICYCYIIPSYKTNPTKPTHRKPSLSYKGIMQNSTRDPTHPGFPHSPFKAQFFQCAPQLAFKGKFVNPLEPVAIISFLNIVRHKSHRSLHSTTIRFARLAPLDDLAAFRFIPFALSLEPFLSG